MAVEEELFPLSPEVPTGRVLTRRPINAYRTMFWAATWKGNILEPGTVKPTGRYFPPLLSLLRMSSDSGKTPPSSTGAECLHDRIRTDVSRSDLGYAPGPQSSTLEGNMNTNSATALIHKGDLAKRHLEAVAAAVLESQRPTTRKVYSGAWSRFQAWAHKEGVTSLPADPVTVAAYLVHRDALGLSFSSLAMDRKAISFFHRRAGLPTPTVSEGVKMTLAGVRNRGAKRRRAEPRQARGLREEGLRKPLSKLHTCRECTLPAEPSLPRPRVGAGRWTSPSCPS